MVTVKHHRRNWCNIQTTVHFFTYSFVVVTVDFIVQLNKEVTIMGLICDT